jgi:uncharacterized membrane protein YhaH (DUF805 family)
MEWMLMPYRRYAEFSGRSRRMEYWMFALFQAIVGLVLYAFLFAGMPSTDENGQMLQAPGMIFYVAVLLLVVFGLASIIPGLAVTVRRLHDTDRSGWWWWLQLIPFFGGLVILVFMCLDGTPGPNRFGPDPQGRFDAEVFA